MAVRVPEGEEEVEGEAEGDLEREGVPEELRVARDGEVEDEGDLVGLYVPVPHLDPEGVGDRVEDRLPVRLVEGEADWDGDKVGEREVEGVRLTLPVSVPVEDKVGVRENTPEAVKEVEGVWVTVVDALREAQDGVAEELGLAESVAWDTVGAAVRLPKGVPVAVAKDDSHLVTGAVAVVVAVEEMEEVMESPKEALEEKLCEGEAEVLRVAVGEMDGEGDTVCDRERLEDRLEQGEAEEVREGEEDPEEQREAEGEREAVGHEVGLGLGLEDREALGEMEDRVEKLVLCEPEGEMEGDFEKLAEVEERRDAVPPPSRVGVNAAERVGVMEEEGVEERDTRGVPLVLGEKELLGDTLGEADWEGL